MDDAQRRARWRLILGRGATFLDDTLDDIDARRDRLVAFLYDREAGPEQNIRRDVTRGADLGASELTVPEWINRVHDLFPRDAIERLERDALERYKLQELVTNPDLLQRATPSMTLLKAILRTKHLMNEEVLLLARRLVRQVVREMLDTFAHDVRQPFSGRRLPQRRSRTPAAKNFDAPATIRRNLKYYDPVRGRLVITTPYFNTRVRRHVDRWRVFILVDQSGSMLDSVIHAAVIASIFWGIRSLRPRLIAFDTTVVDLTDHLTDPVETLLRVQLGGGTDIGQALAYAAEQIDTPGRTLVVLVSDFFDGAPPAHLLATARSLVESGVTLLGLAALDRQAQPIYNRPLAAQLVALGAHVAAMTPGELAAWVADKVQR